MEKLNKILICVFAAILAFISSLSAQDINDAYRMETFSVNDRPTVEIGTSGGSIHAEGHTENEVKVYMIVKRGGRILTPSDTDLEDFEINISRDGNRVIASAERKSSGIGGWFRSGSNISISFVVHAPESAVVDGRTSGGSVSAKNFTNDISLRTSGGSINAESIRANADLRTSGGTITLTDVHGEVNARTSGGSIRADRLNGPSDLRTSGGSIRFENARGAISARTSGGSISAHMTEFSGDLDLRTSGGSITVDMPETENYNLDLSGNRVNVALRNFTGSSERNRVSGSIGNGGPTLAARTSGGSVTVNYN